MEVGRGDAALLQEALNVHLELLTGMEIFTKV
jgi:hypothetical protein